ncbi:hypothetical protein MRB53_038163 [Persea americana]|nr:hypothetical protein MRB53_038163 [Persea americana]
MAPRCEALTPDGASRDTFPGCVSNAVRDPIAATSKIHRLKVFGELVPEFRTALQSFKTSGSRFRVLKTIHPRLSSPQNATQPPPEDSPRSLVILDSSYNPPSIAHQTLAISALTDPDHGSRLPPTRLLLLFSTLNADKAPTPAAFDQRLTMMALFARDLLDEMLANPDVCARVVPVDIGVTTAPYYTDKTAAIESDGRGVVPARGPDSFTY